MHVSDGAYGTLLADHAGDLIVDLLCASDPQLVREAHGLYARAGAREIQSCSFMTWTLPVPDQLAMYRAAIAVAQQTAQLDMKTNTELPQVVLTVGPAADADSFRAAIVAANEASLDVVVETVTSSTTLDLLSTALAHVVLDGRLWVCASLDPAAPHAQARMEELISWCDQHSATPGLNCCAGAQSSLASLTQMMAHMPNARLVPSAGVGATTSAATWAQTVGDLASTLETPIVGGCCGTTPNHIHHLAALLS